MFMFILDISHRYVYVYPKDITQISLCCIWRVLLQNGLSAIFDIFKERVFSYKGHSQKNVTIRENVCLPYCYANYKQMVRDFAAISLVQNLE